MSGCWNRSYALLNNVNTILEHCESDRNVLDDTYYHMIKGEALALRALLHFELFRIFGPSYSKDQGKRVYPLRFDFRDKGKSLATGKGNCPADHGRFEKCGGVVDRV